MNKHNMDKLATMDEYDLKSLFSSIKRMISRKRERKQGASNLEIEMCYVQRELEIRRSRSQAHKEFLHQRQAQKESAYQQHRMRQSFEK